MVKLKDYNDFKKTLHDKNPPTEWQEGLKALWFDAKGDWQASHDIAQDLDTTLGSWLHGYLHRKEGDNFNVGYWYRRAQKEFPKISLAEEHERITIFALTGN